MSGIIQDVEKALQAEVEGAADSALHALRVRLSRLLDEFGASAGGHKFVIKREAIVAFVEPMRDEILKREQNRVTAAFASCVIEVARTVP